MRNLTRKQKALLTKWYKEAETIISRVEILDSVNPLKSVEDLSTEQYEELVKINDTEILYQNINNFLSDLENKD